MKSILKVCNGDEIAQEYDLPGTRYWLIRTGLSVFRVFGWKHSGVGWFIGEVPKLTKVFWACFTDDTCIRAEHMVDGGRAVISTVQREAN